MAVKLYPADFCRWRMTVAVRVGFKTIYRNIQVAFKSVDPVADIQKWMKWLHDNTNAKVVSLFRSYGRNLIDPALNDIGDQQTYLLATLMHTDGTEKKMPGRFVNIPYCHDFTQAGLKASIAALGLKFASLETIDTPAVDDTTIELPIFKMSDLKMMDNTQNPAPAQNDETTPGDDILP